MKKTIIIIVIVLAVLGLGVILFLQDAKNQPVQGDIISETGIHWHANLAIYIKGEKREIPTDVGLGVVHDPFHTHDTTGQLHLEFNSRVTRQDTKLKEFFDNWNKAFNSNCIFEYCSGPEGRVKFLVNGQENQQFENYEVKDKDNLEIRFE